ncbi:hypothetical protein [Brucella sp.]|uniref:hypothetical protein n=1 Tax=Brucella sp. TaxID=52132 RepID=UPI0028A9DE2C|nr:hypothetical protein [Brucella sp.]
MSLLGEKAASDSRVEMEKFFFGGGFDLSSGDPETAYQQKLAEYAEALPNDLSKAAFYRAMEPHRQRMMDGIGKQKVSYMEGQRNSAVVDTFRNIIDDDLAGGKLTATQIAQNVFSRSASNRDFLGLSGDEQNETIFEIAKEYAAKGRPDIVEALLRETRIGADGEKLPAIGRIAKYGTESLKLVETAKDVRDGKVQEDGLVERNTVNDMVVNGTFTLKDAEKLKGKGLFTTKQLGDMVSQSTQNRLTAEKNAYISDLKRSYKKAHEDGKQAVLSEALSISNRVGGIALLKDREIPSEVDEDKTTYTTKQIKDDMVSHMENQWDVRQEQLIANGTPPEQARKQVFGERVSWYGNNGIVNKQWDALLNGIASRSTTEMLVERGHVPEALVQHAELYRDLKATNPAYLSTVMQDAKSKTFLEAYQRGVETLRLDKQGALHYAATRVTMDPAEEARSNLRATEIDSIVNSTMSALGLEKRGPGYSQVYGRVMEMSKSGSTREEIKDNIQKDLETNSVVINGSLVPTSRDLPPDFPELMEMEIQDVYEFAKEREGVESVDDLTVIPVGDSGKWMVVSKSRGYMPLGSGNLITAGRLDVRRNYRRQQEENRLKAFASAKETERDKMREELIADLEKDRANIVR